MTVNGKTELSMEKEYKLGKMVIDTMVNGKMVLWMEKEY